jgi:hypothetical protein
MGSAWSAVRVGWKGSCLHGHRSRPPSHGPLPCLQFEGKYSSSLPAPTYVYPSYNFEDDLAYAVSGDAAWGCRTLAHLMKRDQLPLSQVPPSFDCACPFCLFPARPLGCTVPPRSLLTSPQLAATSSAGR